MNDRVFKLDEFKGGRILGYTEAGGTYPAMVKENGEALIVDITYPPGSLVLFDNRGTIVGPFCFTGVLDLAERVLDGDQRALTDSKSLLTLAAAFVGFSSTSPDDEPTAPELAMDPEPEACSAVLHPRRKYLTGPQVRARYGISEMTLHRWQNNAALEFPKPLFVGRRKYFDEEVLAAWERCQRSHPATDRTIPPEAAADV